MGTFGFLPDVTPLASRRPFRAFLVAAAFEFRSDAEHGEHQLGERAFLP
jgi:hypothetical protein